MTVGRSCCVLAAICALLCMAILPTPVWAIGGTAIVAQEGQPAHVADNWPEGVAELVNDAARTKGWNSWFSEWPNDVNQYAYEIKTTNDLNRLIRKLAAVKAEVRQIRLSYLKEPRALGWVTGLPEGNNVAVVFSIGDQSRIDQWYGRVRKPFGKIEFVAAPVAVPPTLTIFVQHTAVRLERLRIPDEIVVTSGYVPTVFHRWNTLAELEREEQAAREHKEEPAESKKEELDEAAQQAVEQIRAFLEQASRDESGKTSKQSS